MTPQQRESADRQQLRQDQKRRLTDALALRRQGMISPENLALAARLCEMEWRSFEAYSKTRMEIVT